MKKITLILVLLFGYFTANSQVLISLLLGDKLNSDGLEFGLEGGLNWSTISGFESEQYSRSFNLGFYFDIRIKKQWSLYTGTLVKSKSGIDQFSVNDLTLLNARTYSETGEYKQVVNAFLVPVLLKLKIKKLFYVEAGTQLGLTYDSWIEYNSNNNGVEGRIREGNKDQFNKFDIGFMGGAGFKLMEDKGMTFGIKYYHGFLDVYKNIANTKNSSIYLKVNIPIGANKKKKEVE